jgi:hypothetical protein
MSVETLRAKQTQMHDPTKVGIEPLSMPLEEIKDGEALGMSLMHGMVALKEGRAYTTVFGLWVQQVKGFSVN